MVRRSSLSGLDERGDAAGIAARAMPLAIPSRAGREVLAMLVRRAATTGHPW